MFENSTWTFLLASLAKDTAEPKIKAPTITPLINDQDFLKLTSPFAYLFDIYINPSTSHHRPLISDQPATVINQQGFAKAPEGNQHQADKYTQPKAVQAAQQ